ncbi:MAG TPA: M28 family peptidase [Gemmatimonadaceae bacterium]|nr:M28 family peptidase [Gemmatimonadaceae bacterium]
MRPSRFVIATRSAVTAAVVAAALTTATAAAPVHAQSRDEPPRLDSAQLMRDLYALTADSMEGRRIGTPGGARARAYLETRLRAAGITPLRDSFAAPFTSSGRGGDVTGTNLVGVVRGTKAPDQYIVLSAHYDHLGVRNGTVYPGADDNASGTCAVLAIAAWLKAHPPGHSVIIALFDGEEGGLRGSRAFVADPPVALDKVLANVNLDMVGRNAQGELYAAGATPWPRMRPLIEATAKASGVTLRMGHDSGGGHEDWTNQSDQGAFDAKKIPWVYFGVEDHPDYHKPTDFPNRIEPGFFYRSASTVADFVRRFDAAPPAPR